MSMIMECMCGVNKFHLSLYLSLSLSLSFSLALPLSLFLYPSFILAENARTLKSFVVATRCSYIITIGMKIRQVILFNSMENLHVLLYVKIVSNQVIFYLSGSIMFVGLKLIKLHTIFLCFIGTLMC